MAQRTETTMIERARIWPVTLQPYATQIITVVLNLQKAHRWVGSVNKQEWDGRRGHVGRQQTHSPSFSTLSGSGSKGTGRPMVTTCVAPKRLRREAGGA